MITITDAARQALFAILSKAKEGPEVGLRLAVTPEGEIELFPDNEKPGDISYEYEGRKIVFVENSLTDSLDGIVLDAKQTLKDPVLVISNLYDDEDCGGECEGCCSCGDDNDSDADADDCCTHGCCDDKNCN